MNEFFDKSIQEEILKKASKQITVHIPHEYLEQVCKEDGKFEELMKTIITLMNKAQEDE